MNDIRKNRNNKINEEVISKEIIDFSLSKFDMRDLVDDDEYQINADIVLKRSFILNSKGKKYFNEKEMDGFFDNIVEKYNSDLESTNKYGALTYLQKVIGLLDYIKIESIKCLSLETLNQLLDAKDEVEILTTYNEILENRHYIQKIHMKTFKEMLEDERVKMKKSEMVKYFDYIAQLYNSDVVLQDNVTREEYLRAFSKISLKKALSMRMIEIYDLFYVNGPESPDSIKLLSSEFASDLC